MIIDTSVKFFKVKAIFKGKGKKESEVKIHLALEDLAVKPEGEFGEGEKISSIFTRAFHKLGMEQKVGPGPAGQMERLVQSWLEKAKKK